MLSSMGILTPPPKHHENLGVFPGASMFGGAVADPEEGWWNAWRFDLMANTGEHWRTFNPERSVNEWVYLP